jgi:multidrug efflux pump subunit AcrA (membrane-fusion protein)
MKNKILIAFTFIVVALLLFIYTEPYFDEKSQNPETISLKSAGNEIMADGTVESESQAILRFQTGGKLVYLPFKEGDIINSGTLMAQLDSYDIQKRLESALNTYRATRDSFDQYGDNQNSGVAQGSQKYSLETQNKASLGSDQKTNVINDMVKRIADQNQATLDNSVVNVELAQNAFKLSALYSPISGILTHADVDTNYLNITPTTTFIVQDPTKIIFKAQVLENDINFVEVGATVKIKLNTNPNNLISGAVMKIYPEKIKNSKGESIYEVDISSKDLQTNYKFGQTGTIFIKSKFEKETYIVSNWLIIDNQYIWINSDGKNILRKVELGNVVNDQVVILNGIQKNDKLIADPKFVVKKLYRNI